LHVDLNVFQDCPFFKTTLTNETYFKEGFYFLGEFLTGDQDEPSADGRNPDDRNPDGRNPDDRNPDGRNPDNADRPRTFITPEEEQSQPPKKYHRNILNFFFNIYFTQIHAIAMRIT
jgi:hypothetical protein